MPAPRGYTLRYLPIFWEDLDAAVTYIAEKLRNPAAARRLVDATEAAIFDHLKNPTMATVYHSTRERPSPYYWFEVGNYMVFYVVIDDVMEVRRFLYNPQGLDEDDPLDARAFLTYPVPWRAVDRGLPSCGIWNLNHGHGPALLTCVQAARCGHPLEQSTKMLALRRTRAHGALAHRALARLVQQFCGLLYTRRLCHQMGGERGYGRNMSQTSSSHRSAQLLCVLRVGLLDAAIWTWFRQLNYATPFRDALLGAATGMVVPLGLLAAAVIIGLQWDRVPRAVHAGCSVATCVATGLAALGCTVLGFAEPLRSAIGVAIIPARPVLPGRPVGAPGPMRQPHPFAGRHGGLAHGGLWVFVSPDGASGRLGTGWFSRPPRCRCSRTAAGSGGSCGGEPVFRWASYVRRCVFCAQL